MSAMRSRSWENLRALTIAKAITIIEMGAKMKNIQNHVAVTATAPMATRPGPSLGDRLIMYSPDKTIGPAAIGIAPKIVASSTLGSQSIDPLTYPTMKLSPPAM